MPAPPPHGLTRLLQAYYWLTPVFLVGSLQYGIDVRVPFLDALPGARAAYYALCFACAGIVSVRPGLTAFVGRVESTLCASLLILTTWAAWFNTIERAASDSATLENPFTTEAVACLVLSATAFMVSSLLNRHAQGLRTT